MYRASINTLNYAWCGATDGAIGYGKHIPQGAIDFAATPGSVQSLRRVVESVAVAAGGSAHLVPGYARAGAEKMSVLIRFASEVERKL